MNQEKEKKIQEQAEKGPIKKLFPYNLTVL